MKKVIFPGSFDPITKGHISLISRAQSLFDHIIVVVIENKNKQPMFNLDQRVTLVRLALAEAGLKDVSVMTHDGLIVDFCQQQEVYFLLRGLRNSTDLAYEHNMSIHNNILEPKIETVCLLTYQNYFHISSSAARELIMYKTTARHLLPNAVWSEIKIIKELDENL